MSDQALSWVDDLHQIKGNVSQLQSTLNQLLTRTPSVKQFRELKRLYDSPSVVDSASAHSIQEKLKAYLNTPHTKVAVRLKSLYDRGYFPFLVGLSRINFKHPKADRFVGYLLDYNPTKPTVELAGGDAKEPTSKPDDNQWDSRTDVYPPVLPPIDNASLLRLIVTDKSLRQPWDYLESETEFHDFNNNHNRKLSLHGESLLDLILVEILDQEFPKLHEDDVRFLKRRLNATHILAKLAYSYNLADLVSSQIPTDASVDEKFTVFRNVFLAYLAGLSKSDYSFPEIKSWVLKLYQPIIDKVHEHCLAESNLKNPYALAFSELQFLVLRVNNLVDDKTKKIRYTFKDSEEPIPDVGHAVYLVLQETVLGVGTSTVSLTEAKQKAVYASFEDPVLKAKMLEIIIENYRIPRYSVSDRLQTLNYGDRPAEKSPDRKEDCLNHAEKSSGDKKQTRSDDSYSPGASDTEYEPTDSKQEPAKEKREETEASHPRRPLQYGMLPPIPNVNRTKNI